jgi:hypothetical protein
MSAARCGRTRPRSPPASRPIGSQVAQGMSQRPRCGSSGQHRIHGDGRTCHLLRKPARRCELGGLRHAVVDDLSRNNVDEPRRVHAQRPHQRNRLAAVACSPETLSLSREPVCDVFALGCCRVHAHGASAGVIGRKAGRFSCVDLRPSIFVPWVLRPFAR